MSFEDKLKNFFRDSRQKVYFVGAGISRDPPSCLPIAGELSQTILSSVSDGNAYLTQTVSRFISGWINSGSPGARLEVLLELARIGIGSKALLSLECLDCTHPNAYHYLLAELIAEGHIVVTTNFDSGIETAYYRTRPRGQKLRLVLTAGDWDRELRNTGQSGLLVKLHGSLRNSLGQISTTTVQATLGSLLRGLPRWNRQLLERLTRDRDLVFLGYSGSDDFDVTPFFSSWNGTGRILWSSHDSGLLTLRNDHTQLRRSVGALLRILFQRTRDVIVVEGPSIDVVSFLPQFRAAASHVTRQPHGTDWKHVLETRVDALHLSDFQRHRFIGKILQQNGELDAALECFTRSLHVASGANGLDEVIALDDLAECEQLSRHFDRAVALRSQQRIAAQRVGGRRAQRLVAQSWLGAAESLRHGGDWQRASQGFMRAQAIFLKQNRTRQAAYCSLGIGGIKRTLADFGGASKAYAAASRGFLRGRSAKGHAMAEWGVAEILKYRGDYSAAHRKYEETAFLSQKAGLVSEHAWAIWGLAEIARLQGQVSSAIRLYLEARDCFLKRDLCARAWCDEGLARCAIVTVSDPSQALAAAEKGFAAAGARLGMAVAALDSFHYLTIIGDQKPANAIRLRLESLSLPARETAQLSLLSAEYFATVGDPSYGRLYTAALARFKKISMSHAYLVSAVAAGRRRAVSPKTLSHGEDIATRLGLISEQMALRELRLGHTVPNWVINLPA